MNKHDSERISGLLEAGGFKASTDITDSDLVVYYTCCVRESADDRFYGQLSSIKYKKGAKVAVGGCLAQKEGENLLKKHKEIDLVFGTQNLKELPSLLNQLNGQSISNTDVYKDFNSDLPAHRESPFKAWIAVNRGCNNHCTYCIVPSVRGPEISRPIDEIVKETKELVSDGVIEATLLGQNVNSYGSDIYPKPSFAELLQEISQTDLQRIRFTTSHPKDLSKEIVMAIKNLDNVCDHIHLPVQAGSDSVLKKMGRRYTKDHYLESISMIREHLPNVSITTDIMVGFPGETESDFEDTLDVVQKARFDQAFTFIYSVRKGTVAAKMKDQLDYQVKLKRFKKLIQLQDNISFEQNKIYEGRVEEILVDGLTKKDPSMLSGRTKTNKLVHFKGDSSLVGKLINVKIIEAKPFFMLGESIG